MRTERFEDIDAWHLARELARKVYQPAKKRHLRRTMGKKTIYGWSISTSEP
jgi:hypothetical protein